MGPDRNRFWSLLRWRERLQSWLRIGSSLLWPSHLGTTASTSSRISLRNLGAEKDDHGTLRSDQSYLISQFVPAHFWHLVVKEDCVKAEERRRLQCLLRRGASHDQGSPIARILAFRTPGLPDCHRYKGAPSVLLDNSDSLCLRKERGVLPTRAGQHEPHFSRRMPNQRLSSTLRD